MQHTQIISIDVMEKQAVGVSVKRFAFEFEYICYDRTSKLEDKVKKKVEMRSALNFKRIACSNDELSVFVELHVTQLYELK